MFTCVECGKECPPDPSCVREAFISNEPPPGMTEEEIEAMCEAGCGCDQEPVADNIQLPPEQLAALDRGEAVQYGAEIICHDCFDRMANEQGGAQ